MENKNIRVLYALTVAALLLVIIILINYFGAQRERDFKKYAATISHLVAQKDQTIIFLEQKLAVKTRANADLTKTLTDARNAFENLSKK